MHVFQKALTKAVKNEDIALKRKVEGFGGIGFNGMDSPKGLRKGRHPAKTPSYVRPRWNE